MSALSRVLPLGVPVCVLTSSLDGSSYERARSPAGAQRGQHPGVRGRDHDRARRARLRNALAREGVPRAEEAHRQVQPR